MEKEGRKEGERQREAETEREGREIHSHSDHAHGHSPLLAGGDVLWSNIPSCPTANSYLHIWSSLGVSWSVWGF